jgi:predicted dehydrogenase
MERINVGVIGTGWCGGIRADTCAANVIVDQLHIAENKPSRLKEVAKATNPVTATENYQELLDNKDIDAIFISATPETLHFPMAKECLESGKHVFLEKPISITLEEADELITIAR